MSDTVRWFWLSFAGPEGNRGIAIMAATEEAIDLIDHLDDRVELLRERGQFEDVWFFAAVQMASLAGINPGGDVQGHEVTDHIDKIPKNLRGRLVQKSELEEAGLL